MRPKRRRYESAAPAFPKRGFEKSCPCIHQILVDGAYVDARVVVVPEHTKVAIRAVVARESAERLLKMPSQNDGVN